MSTLSGDQILARPPTVQSRSPAPIRGVESGRSYTKLRGNTRGEIPEPVTGKHGARSSKEEPGSAGGGALPTASPGSIPAVVSCYPRNKCGPLPRRPDHHPLHHR